MALKIKTIPVLEGEAAIRFEEAAQKNTKAYLKRKMTINNEA
jgi:hypothetical protein